MIWKSSYLLPRMLTLAALTVLPLVALHGYTLYAEYRRAEAATLRTLAGQAALAARAVDDALGLAQGQLRLAARRRAAQQWDALRCTSLLQSLDKESGLMTHFEVHAPDGSPVCGSQSGGSSASGSQASQAWVRQVLPGQGPWLSEPQELERSDGSEPRRHVVRLALALDSGLARGPEVFSVLVDLQQLSERLSPAALPPGSVLTLYDRHWHVMARNPDFQDWVGRSALGVGGAHMGSAPSIIRAFGVDGVERVHASSNLRHGGLRITAGVPVAALTAPLTDEAGRAVVVGILVLCGSLGLAAYWSGILSRSLRRLAQAAAHLAGGRQDVQIDAKLPGELGALASQFNLMLQALQARSQALEASQRRAVRFGQLNQVLSEAAHAVARSPQPQQLFERICRICVDTGQAKVAWVCIDGHPAASAAGSSHADDALLQAPFVEGDSRTGLGVRWHERCASGEPFVENDLAKALGGDDVRPLLLERGVGSVASLPFFVRGRHAGKLNLYADAPGFFDDDAVRLLTAVTADLGFALDAREQEKARIDAEQALAQREQQLAGIIDTAMDAIITVDASYRIVVFNRAAAQMLQVSAEEMIGATVDRFVPAVARAGHHRHMERFAHGPAGSQHHGPALRLKGLRATGEEFPLDATLVKFGSGSELLMTVTLRDVSKIEEAEAAKEAQARAAAASRAKSEFISHMSHELRTPLNAVLGFSQLLQGTARERLSLKEMQQLDMIFLAGAQLRSLIEEALDLSRIEAGRVDLRMEAVDLGALVQALMLLLEPLAQEQGVRLLMPPEPATPVHARTDRNRVRQVLLNILSNAIKYNRRGGTVTATLREAGDEVELEVVDTGLGMSAEQLQSLFEPFNRLGREDSGIEGTGIGMALTRRLVEILDGSLSVSSEPDVGTSVRVRLPRVQPERPAAATGPAAQPEAVRDEPAQAEGPRGRVLYVEDNPVNVILVQALLEHWHGVELVTAPDVETGVRMARASPPDLVLLDMHLGNASGHDFLARVRSDSRTAALRVVALSASAMPDEVNAARQAGVMDYWTKPLDAQEFRAGISRLLSGSRQDPA